jgi:histidinol-phosphate/aromatic aminotransferase/cobyric acid decarboxylase-like protein
MTEQVSNLAVLRGFSKAYWQGGLRLAYCVSSAPATARVRSLIPPMLASSLSLRIGRAILELGDIAAPLRERVPAARSEMLTCLRDAGCTSMHASSAHVPYVFLDAASVDVQRVEAAGILGKPQPFWSASETGVLIRYRLSVPLAPRRMEQFRRKIEGCR